MKKIILFSMIVIIIAFAGSCKSKPPAPAREQPPPVQVVQPVTIPQFIPEELPVSPPEIVNPVVVDNTAYNRHQSGVILDGAATHTVRSGDTLSSIARQRYQDGSYYPLILMVTDVTIADPDVITPGLQLIIPDIRTNMNDPRARENINRYFLQIAQFEEQRGRHGTAELIRNHTR